MARKLISTPSISRVVAGSKAILELPVGPTYQKLLFKAGGTGLDVTDIERMDLLVNGNVIQTYKNLQRLMDINTYFGRSVDSVNEFMIHFFRGELHELNWRRAPGLGTANISTFTIEMQLAAGAPADITLSCEADIDTVPQPIGAFTRIREFGMASSVVGVLEADKLPKAGDVYAALHLFKPDISKVELEVDQIKVIDLSKASLERFAKSATPKVRVPVSARATHVDFLYDGDAGQCLNTKGVGDMRLKMTLDSVGAVDVVAETFDTL